MEFEASWPIQNSRPLVAILSQINPAHSHFLFLEESFRYHPSILFVTIRYLPECCYVLSPTRKETSYSDQTLTFASHSKTIQKVVRPTRSPRQQWPPRTTKISDLSIVFSVYSGQGLISTLVCTAVVFPPGGSAPYTCSQKARTVIYIRTNSTDHRTQKLDRKT